MSENKYKKVVRLFPKTFRPIDGDEVITNLPPAESSGKTIAELWNANVGNPVVNAILRGFAGADQTIAEQIQETKASLFVKTAESRQLDVIASSLGVSRPSSLGLPDAAFQNLIPPLSLQAKQVRTSFYNAMDAFWGPEFSRSNLETLNTTTSLFDLRLRDTLTFQVDNRDSQSIVIRNTSGIANVGSGLTLGQATALELNNLIKDNITGVTSEILVDPITQIETVRVLTTTPGLKGSIQFTVNRPNEIFNDRALDRMLTFAVDSPPNTPFDPSTQIAIDGDFRTGSIEVGDSLLIDSEQSFMTAPPSVIFSRTILAIGEVLLDGEFGPATIVTIGSHPPLDLTTAQVLSFSRDRVLPPPIIFPTDKAELLKQAQRTVIYEIRPNEVVIEIPAFIPTLARGLKGSLHLHNGPLINNLIDRGIETNYILPTALFEDTPDDLYRVMSDQSWITFPDPSNRTVILNPPVNLEPAVYEATVDNGGGAGPSSFSLVMPDGDATNENNYGAVGNTTLRGIIPTPSGDLTFEFFDSGGPSPADIAVNVSTFTTPNQAFREALGAALATFTQFFSSVVVDSTSINITLAENGVTTIPTFTNDPFITKSAFNNFVLGVTKPLQTFKFFVRVENPLARSVDTEIWRGAFLFDPNGTRSSFTVTGQSAIITGDAVTNQDVLAAGQVHPRVSVEAATNSLPTTSQLAVIGFGTSTQESALIRYRGRASDNIIELDPSFLFTKTQPAGTYINIISSASPFVPDKVGNDYPIYLTSSADARITIENILRTLAAAGVVVNFVVIAPDYKYLIDNPFLETDDVPGSGSPGQQDGYKYIIDNPTETGDSAPSV